MFNSTHTLIGVAMARTGLERWTPYATWTAVIAANLPDIDIVTLIWGTPAYIEYHRGITHSLLGVPLLSLLLAGIIWKISGNFWKTFIIALLATASHPLLDYGNNYGVRPFLPLDDTWYYGDTLFIIDPLLDLALAGTLVGATVFRRHRQLIALGGIGLALAYIGTRVQLREMSRERLAEFTSQIATVQRSAVLPQMLEPFVWIGIIETDTDISSVAVNVFSGVTGELARMPKQNSSVIVERAGTARTAEVFRGFARFPVLQVDSLESAYRVLMADFRFHEPDAGIVFGTEILLDKSLRVIGEEMGFNQRIVANPTRALGTLRTIPRTGTDVTSATEAIPHVSKAD
jgi:inner membrane protein